MAAMPMPMACIRVGHSANSNAAKAMVNSAWLCTITAVSPTGTPWAMAMDCDRNWPRNSVALIATRSGQETLGLRTNRHGTAAMAKRSVVINSGENSSSAIRLATKASPQITATMTAMPTSAGFIVFLALLIRLWFAQQIGAVQWGVIIDRFQHEAGLGQHAFDHPAEGGIFVPHMGDDAVAVVIVVLDAEIRPLIDVALGAVGHADEDDVAQVEIGAGLQRVVDPRQRHRLPEIRQVMQRELADDQIIGVRLIGEAQHARRLGADRNAAVLGLNIGERQHRRRNVYGVDLGTHERRFAGQHAVAAADIGHPPARLGAQHGERLAAADIAVVMAVVDRGDRGIQANLPPLGVIPVARQHVHIPSGPRPIAATPVRDTSTRPSGRIRSMN